MADGELTLKLDDETLARLRDAAAAAGSAVEDYASNLISRGVEDRWALAHEALAEYDRTGVSYSLEEGWPSSTRRWNVVSPVRREVQGPADGACDARSDALAGLPEVEIAARRRKVPSRDPGRHR